MNKEELEQYKHDCEFALTSLSYDEYGHFIEGLRTQINLLNRLINEHFELLEKYEKAVNCYKHVTSQYSKLETKYVLLKSNPPLMFEELNLYKPYWDNKENTWCYFTILNKEIKTGVYIKIGEFPYMGAFKYEKFEENRFYCREVKEND